MQTRIVCPTSSRAPRCVLVTSPRRAIAVAENFVHPVLVFASNGLANATSVTYCSLSLIRQGKFYFDDGKFYFIYFGPRRTLKPNREKIRSSVVVNRSKRTETVWSAASSLLHVHKILTIRELIF